MNEVFKIGNEMILVDPNPDAIPFLKKTDPGFEIASSRPTLRFKPNFQISKENGIFQENSDCALKALYKCELCGWKCSVNRFREKGRCGLSDKIHYYAPFIHIAEEAVINPAIVVNFANCSMDCVYCLRHALNGRELCTFDIDTFWRRIEALLKNNPNICSLEFSGGDPTLYLPWVLLWLKYAPDDLNLPVVWNSNLFMNSQALKLLNGIVDVYLPDFVFSNRECANRLSGSDEYPIFAKKGIEHMINQNAKVIVRILVLPGHVECCGKKILESLSPYGNEIWISILDQYIPAYKAHDFREIFRRPTSREIEQIKILAKKYGLRDINEDYEDFWKE